MLYAKFSFVWTAGTVMSLGGSFLAMLLVSFLYLDKPQI